MAGEHFRHIFLNGPTRTRGYTSPRRGGSGSRIFDRDRAGHSSHLQTRLQEAWAQEDTQLGQAVVALERHGAYIEFESEPGFELAVLSLEATRSGVRLQNVRTEGEGEAKRTLAVVFVPHSKRGHFLNKIQDFADKDRKTGKPYNQKLISSISDIRRAVLKSFWRSDEWSLVPDDAPDWVEVWLGGDTAEGIERFGMILGELRIESEEGFLKFPERIVKLIRATRTQLEQLIEASDEIAEFRVAKQVATVYIELDNKEQTKLAQDLFSNTQIPEESDVVACILDSGVNRGHILLEPLLDEDDVQTVRENWGSHDDEGHGTLMAGTVAYGDLLALLNSGDSVRIGHRLESVRILPPPPDKNDKHLWGYLTIQGVSLAEIQSPDKKRVVCLAVTSTDDRDRGRPSSWSGAVDEMTSGYEDDGKRLVIISAGNVTESENWRNYPDDNKTNEVHDPGQSWNALTVGAYTEKTRIDDPTLTAYEAIAPAGGLSPYSTTSTTWPARRWPIKPEVLFEGGNVARGPNDSIFDTEDLKLLSTSHDPQTAQFSPFFATSAAAALAGRMAAQIQKSYLDAWPETVRGLIVHSAAWTDKMKDQFLADETKGAYARLLRVCGYGLPDLERAMYCLTNSLTIISQASLQPYDKVDGRYVTRDMHLYNLPWPADELRDLGATQVSMRVTLSYFIEPGPGEIGWEDRYRYPSHALRFDVNGPGESEEEFVSRVNTQARDDGEHPGTQGAGQSWVIGEARNVGSIHSDIWQGKAVDLAASNKVAVYPGSGWWKERQHLNRWDRRCRYSLLVSISTPEQEIDIYTPVATQIGTVVPIEISTSG